MKTQKEIMDKLQSQESISVGPAVLTSGVDSVDFSLEWRGEAYCFEVKANPLSTPRALVETIRRAKEGATSRNPSERRCYPLVVTPYLSKKALDTLAAEGVSGIDLCGNGILMAGDILFVYVTGEKNKYPKSTKLRNVYSRKSSIVPRALLEGPRFRTVKIFTEYISKGIGKKLSIAASQIFKVLQQMEEDMLITRKEGGITLLLPEETLEKLRENYIPPTIESRWIGWCENLENTLETLSQLAKKKEFLFVESGKRVAGEYCGEEVEAATKIYTRANPEKLISALRGEKIEQGERFANLEIIQTSSEWVYTNLYTGREVRRCSPVQIWLEMSQGDKRQKEMAEQIYKWILKSYDERVESWWKYE